MHIAYYLSRISCKSKKEVIELVRRYKIHSLNIGSNQIKDTDYSIEVITSLDEIPLLAEHGYNIQILEEVGGICNHHKQQQFNHPHTIPVTIDFSSASLKDSMTS